MVPRTGPLSASSALATTSWYQRGKSSARGVSTRAMAANPRHRAHRHGGTDPAAQDDAARCQQHRGRSLARVAVVDDQVGQAALDEAGEAEPLPRTPGAGRAERPPSDIPACRCRSSISSATWPCSIPPPASVADVDRHAGVVRRRDHGREPVAQARMCAAYPGNLASARLGDVLEPGPR